MKYKILAVLMLLLLTITGITIVNADGPFVNELGEIEVPIIMIDENGEERVMSVPDYSHEDEIEKQMAEIEKQEDEIEKQMAEEKDRELKEFKRHMNGEVLRLFAFYSLKSGKRIYLRKIWEIPYGYYGYRGNYEKAFLGVVFANY